MDVEDGNSSEGIVCSSDDEFDGLSEAVENHIMGQESTTNVPIQNFQSRLNSNQFHNRGYEDVPLERSQFSARQHIRKVPDRFHTDHFPIQQQHPDLPLQGRYTHTHGGEYRHLAAEQSFPPPHILRNSPPKRAILTPRQDVMRRNLSRNNHAAHEMRHVGPPPMPLPQGRQHVPPPGYMGNNPGHVLPGPPVYPENLPPHIGTRSHSSERYPPVAHIGNVPNPLPVAENYDIVLPTNAEPARSRSMEAYHEEHQFEYDSKKMKMPPKPVLFKIKSKPQPKVEYVHPLDPFSPPSEHGIKKEIGARRWSHDKYEEQHYENMKLKKEAENVKESPRIVKREETKRNEKGRRKRRTRNSAESPLPVMAIKAEADRDQIHRKRRRTRSSQRTKSNTSSKFSESWQGMHKSPKKERDSMKYESDRKVTLVEEEVDETDIVYEEEEVLEHEDTVSHLETRSFASDSEDDEELLALRLNALTSALPPSVEASESKKDFEDDEELRLRLNALTSSIDAKIRVNKTKESSQEKKPKHMLRRVVETPKRASRRRRSMRKSGVADQFLKQYSAISDSSLKKSAKKKLPVKPARKVAVNYNAPQLTLFGEIVKNHQTITKTDALRYIRHHPDEAAKTDIFLNLMKRDELNVTEVVDLHKQNLNQNKAKPKEGKTSQANDDKTNYDEIEMDLDDGDSDTNLVPPGTDRCLIKPPALEPLDVPETSKEQDLNSTAAEIKKQSSAVPATPTQESIWSMLEHSTLLAPADQDIDSTITDAKKERPRVGTPSRESMWSMLEHPSVLNEKTVSGSPEATEKRVRISSEDAEIDDESLVMLREVLLQQLDKNQSKELAPKPDNIVSSSSEKMQVAAEKDQEVNLLPSQYPYQPPTLFLQSSLLTKTNAITSVTPTSTVAVSNEKDPSVNRPNTRASAALRAAVDQKAVPSSPAVFPSGSNTPILRSSSPPFRVAPVPPLHIANPGAFESGLGAVAVYSPSGLSEITKAAIAMSSINMTSIHFKPPMASTPAVPLTPKPNKLRGKAFWKARKKQRRKAARAAKKQKMKNSSGATQNAGVLKPVAVNITNTPKGHPLNTGMSRSAQLLNQPPAGVTVKTSNIAKLTSTEATVASGPKNQSTDPAKLAVSSASTQSPQTVTAALKPQTPKIKPRASKSCAQSPQLSTLSQKTVPKSPISEDLVTSTQTSQSQNTVLKNSPKMAISMGSMPPGGSISTQSSNTSAKSLTSPDNSARSLKLSNVTAPSSVLKNPPKASTSVTTATSAQLAKTVLPGPPTVSSQQVVVKPVANLDSSAQSMKLSTVLTQLSTTVMNNPPKVTISGGLKSSAQTSKTVFKSATTLIKSTRVSSKRPAESSAPDPAKRKALVAAEAAVEKPVHLRLPRHQPVVVNIGGSSDEDDSVLSPTRHRNTAQNPLDYHKNMLEAMIKQARAQTSVKQKTKEDDKAIKSSSAQNANQTLKVSSCQNAERAVPKTQPQVKNSTKSAVGKNASVKRQTSSEIKSKARLQKQSSVDQNRKDTVSHLRQTREKFLKLKTLIGKDEVAYARLMKIKESKRSELKAVEDELKEMIHRVAAIKGKAARCEDLIKRYEQQETKIKTRLEKREGLKLKLKDRIKRQMLKARSEQLAKKMEAVTITADTKSNQNAATVSKATVNVSPAKSQSQEKLDQEKQRLLAVEQQLAAEINKMKKSDGNAAATGPRRVSLSKAVRSHLAKYKETKKSNNPTAHDLSLSKIAITALSPVRNLQTSTPTSALSPAGKLLMSPVSSRGASPVAQKVDSAAVVETNEIKKNDKQGSIESNPVEEKSSDVASEVELGKLRKSLHRNFTDSKSLLQECDQPFPDFSHSAKSWHKKTPDFFKNWKVDVSEVISQSSREDINERRTYEFQLYESPLRTFRSYRLSPFLRMKEKLTIKSRTFSHKINPEQILCKYDLTGTCQDPDCKGQHLKQYELSPSELILDLLSYCPELLGENLNKDLEYKDLIKLAESACDKLCGTSNNQTNTMSVDEKCILITSKINATLRNKAPFTTVMRPRKINVLQDRNKMPWKNYLQQDFDVDNNGFIDSDKVISLNLENKIEHPDSFVKDDERYFIERNPGSLYRIEEALKQNSHDIQLWLELAYKKMQKRSDGQQSSLEIGLHTMCLALEENPYVGELWGHYLGLLRRHKGAESEQDRNEMLSQAIELVPLSTHVWNQLLSWDCDIIKREFLYDQLISNLIRNVESDEIMDEMPHDVASRWLLQTVLQKVQLQLLSHPITEVLSFLEMTLKNFSQQCRSISSTVGNFSLRCLTPKDLSALWLCYINVKYFKTLPQCFLPCVSRSDVSAKSCLGVIVSPGFDVKLCFDTKSTLDTILYCDLCADLNVAIKECATSKEAECIECIELFCEKMRLEIFQQYWNTAVDTCELLWTKLSKSLTKKNFSEYISENEVNKILTDVAITWADVLVKKGDVTEATKVFENAVMQNPSDAHLCYEAALFQLNQESTDVDEVLLYFESCASAYLKIEKDTLTAKELRNIFRYLLKLPLPLTFNSPGFVSEMMREAAKKSKAYFWLIYIILLKMSEEKSNTVMDTYELSVIDVEDDKDRRQIWLKYLLYRQSHAPVTTEPSAAVSKIRQTWLRNFTAAVRRCILTCSSDLKTDDVLNCNVHFSDYSFHNEIASIYLSCFHTRQQTSTAYIFLTELTPYNIPLLLRACRFFLSFGDYSTIMSILWKVTSSASCQDKTIWKISIAAHFSRGRVAKAIHLSQRSVEAMQYSHELWSDYLALLKAFGKQSDFATEKDRCSSVLQVDATRLLPDTFS